MFQDSANKLEENVYSFGRTVETLLLRFGKVPRLPPDVGTGGPPAGGQGDGEFCQETTLGTRPRKKCWSLWRGDGGWLRLPVPGATQLGGGSLGGDQRLLGVEVGSPLAHIWGPDP